MTHTTTNDTTTIQVWPSGRMYEYRENSEGTLEVSTTIGDPKRRMLPATDRQRDEIRASRLAEMYADRDVLCCDSMLVDDLLKAAYGGDLTYQSTRQSLDGYASEPGGNLASAFGPDEICNLSPDPEAMSTEECEEWLTDHGIQWDEDDRDGAYTDLINEHSEPAEVMEWWRVSQWLCGQLHAIGEVTIDNGYGCWWGRCCTGQSFLMDGTLQQVAERCCQ